MPKPTAKSVYTVPASAPPQPLKDFLRRQVGVSTNLWKKIKHSEEFRLNDLWVNPALAMVKGGDIISYELPIKTADYLWPENLPLEVRYEDEFLLVVNKPPGQLVHPTRQEISGTLASAVLWHYKERGEVAAFHPVHRLDRNTSGLVLIAKAPQIHYQLSPHGAKKFQREYLALVTGTPTPKSGVIDAPIGRDPRSIICRCITPEGKPAITHYETLWTTGEFSLLKLRLETGRTHQIRVHLSHLGHPLLGDDLYGGERKLISRQALHAVKIAFTHPVTGQEIVVTAPLPPDMRGLIISESPSGASYKSGRPAPTESLSPPS
ncbi:MAG: RluA family pseudouridine synthase [Selenomonadaceae bacterium]|nr:RluA family pseudouridine synthase [Selenomonadaceae bacterium]